MDTASARSSTHPLVIIAALAVTLFCLVGIAALMGWLPSSKGDQAPATVASPASTTEARTEATAPAKTATAEPREVPARRVQNSSRAASRPVATRANAPVVEEARRVEPPAQVAAADIPPPPPARAPVAVEPPKPACSNCGVVEAIRTIQKEAPASGIGAAAGGVLGGVVGHQLGNGRGRDLMTVVGAVGGAVAGHQVEKARNQSTSYEITVRFDDGSTQRVTQQEAPAWRQGDRVRVVNGSIRAL